MKAPRLLLISCTPPSPEGVGGIFLQDLCVPYPKGLISAFLPLGNVHSFSPTNKIAERLALKLLPMGPVRPQASIWGIAGKTLACIQNEYAFRSHVSNLLSQAVAFAHQQRPDKIWAVLDAPASVALARPMALALGLPLHTLIWDDPRHLASAFALDRLSRRRFLVQFQQAVRSSERCAVISQPMADHIEQQYQVPCVIVRHGLDILSSQFSRDTVAPDGVFRIGYAGTMNAPCAFAALIRALDSVNWHLCGKPVELVVTGPRLDIQTQSRARVHYFGWLPTVAQAVEFLAQVDVAYLPQPFAPDRQHLARYSFPSKLTTYLAAQRPLLLHAPSYGSLASYNREHKTGLSCDSLDPQEIVRSLEPLISDPRVYAEARSWAALAHARDFTKEKFRTSFARFIGEEAFEGIESHLT